jgi:hypothetical protein
MNRLSRLLLASTCLTAVSAAPAAAVPELEPNNSLATAQVLPAGTTQVTGTLFFPGDTDDLFRLDGLPPGTFTITLDITDPVSLSESGMQVRTSSNGFVAQNFLVDGSQLTGSIPGDGTLVLSVFATVQGPDSFGYTLDIAVPRAAAVPQPSVLGLLAAGAAGLALGGWRRKPRI